MAQTAPAPNLAGEASDIGGYQVVRTLVPGQTWLVTAAGGAGRTLILKALDDDCIWKSQLHPNVKDRLGRVRELAHSGVANLYGVERDAGLTYLVWEYVAGDTFVEYATAPTRSQRDVLILARDLVLEVETLHARGIVHGALKGENAIVTPDGRVVITHVSPLLYCDPAEDVQAVVALLSDLTVRRHETESPLARLLRDVSGEELTPRRLATRMGALLDSRDADAATAERQSDRPIARRIRRRAMLGATATALLAAALFVSMKQYAVARTPKPPTPPQAGRDALQAPLAPGAQGNASAAPGARPRANNPQ